MGANRGPDQYCEAALGNNFLSLKHAERDQGNPFRIYSAVPVEESYKNNEFIQYFKFSRTLHDYCCEEYLDTYRPSALFRCLFDISGALKRRSQWD